MRHALEEKSTPEQIKVAQEAADWLLDGIATATQDRMFLRGDPEYDEVVGEAILANGKIACLRALHNLTPDLATSDTDPRALVERLQIKSGVMKMSEPIVWGSDTALMDEAADTITALLVENERLLRRTSNDRHERTDHAEPAERGRTMKFDILNRFTGAVQFTAEIDSSEYDNRGVKVGLAVRWAVKNGANLDRANLVGAYLVGANLNGVNLDRANLDGANLYGANLVGANLDGASLYGANFCRSNLYRAYLNGANLVGANLCRSNLYRAFLNGANLDRAFLIGANLYRASLNGANLNGANLEGANLSGANLEGANLSGAIGVNDWVKYIQIEALEAERDTAWNAAIEAAAECVGHITQSEDRDAILTLKKGEPT